MKAHDEIALTRELLRLDTINPPGNERDCAHRIGRLLQDWGYAVDFYEYADRRTSLIARLGGSDSKAPICLTGHIDTVPLGTAKWSRDPFSGEADGDKLYGRGSSDMKAGVAGILLAARNLAGHLRPTAGVVLVLTAAEEGGCIGSRHMIQVEGLLGRAGAMVVGEPTSNYPSVGHKGSMKMWARFRGVTAHGSMPHLGVNAIYKAAHAAAKLEKFEFHDHPHPVMGGPSLNVGTFHAGQTINSVPDEAVLGVDVRSIVGMNHAEVLARLQETLGTEAELDVFQDMPAVWTAPENEWMQRVFELCAKTLGEKPEPRTVSYNSDAGNFLKSWRGAPTVILGPGEPDMAHQTDEYCRMSRIRESVVLYEEIIRDWCGI
jgi:succinyl-diaminopimelate desuccinylase